MITQIKFVSIPTHDQDKALDFYTRKLGFKVLTDQPFDDKQRWIELWIGSSETRFVLFTMEEHRSRIGSPFNGAFACDDVEKTYRELMEKGVEFVAPPSEQEWRTFAIMKDLDGNQLVLSSR